MKTNNKINQVGKNGEKSRRVREARKRRGARIFLLCMATFAFLIQMVYIVGNYRTGYSNTAIDSLQRFFIMQPVFREWMGFSAAFTICVEMGIVFFTLFSFIGILGSSLLNKVGVLLFKHPIIPAVVLAFVFVLGTKQEIIPAVLYTLKPYIPGVCLEFARKVGTYCLEKAHYINTRYVVQILGCLKGVFGEQAGEV